MQARSVVPGQIRLLRRERPQRRLGARRYRFDPHSESIRVTVTPTRNKLSNSFIEFSRYHVMSANVKLIYGAAPLPIASG